MTHWTRGSLAVLTVLAGSIVAREAIAQATAVTFSGTTYSQNFDGITTGQTSSIADAAPGWSFWRSGTSSVQPNYTLSGSNTTAVTQNAGTVGTGVVTNSSSGGAYLWVTGTLASGTDKSIGFLSTGSYPGTTSAAPGQSLAILFGFTNTTGATITNLDLGWNYERFRQGTRTQSWEFYTSTDGSTWSANTLGNSPLYTGTATNVVYNPPESTATAVSIPSLSIANGASYYLRWSFVTTGSWTNSQGLGLDDFTMNLTTSGGGGPTDLYWDGGAGWGNTAPGTGGSGAWADGSGAWDGALKANFGGTAGTITAGIVTASNGLAFTTPGYTVTGGTITLAAASIGLNTINTGTDASAVTTVDSVLAGSAGLMRMGQGTLVLGGANTFTGGLTLSSGTLQIASDANLGDAAGPVSLNGTLKTPGDVSLGSGRAISGGASLDIAPGTTLTVGGSYATASTALLNSGTLDLQGATRSPGSLTFNTAATVNGNGAISLTGITASSVTSGTAIINPAIAFSSGDKTVSVGAGGTLVLAGDIAGTTGRIVTNSAGRLVVSGSFSGGGYNIGTTSATPVNGGTVVLGQTSSSGTGQSFFNYGTIEAATPIATTAGLSIGGREGTPAILNGSPMTFSGSTRFFSGFGATGQLRLDVNNATTFSGVFGPTGGTAGTYTGIVVGGTGSLAFAGNASLLVDAITLQDTVDLIVSGTLGSGVTVGSGNTLGGSGVLAGTISGAGQLLPGNSPGILTAAALDPTAGLDVTLEFTGFTPSYSTASASVNDVIRLTSPTPFGSAFGSSSSIDIFLGVSGIADGDSFQGGFFTDTPGDFLTSLSGATTSIYVLGNGAGTDAFLAGQGYYSFANWNAAFGDPAMTMSLATVALSADFGAGNVDGQVMVLNAVPEPGAMTLGGVGVVLAGLGAWRRRRASRTAAA